MKKQLKPRTDNHFDYVRSISENTVTLCTGPAGSGKSFIAAGMACQYLQEGKVKKILVTRPMVQAGRDTLGFLKGTLEEKVMPFMSPMIEHLIYFLGKDNLADMVKENIVQIKPLELIRGENFYNSFIVGDEFQNADYGQIKAVLSRFHKGCKVVLNGDHNQSDLFYEETKCDYEIAINKLKNLNGLGIVNLTYRDIQRDKIVAPILKRLEPHENIYNL